MEVERIEEGLWRWTASLPTGEVVGCAFVDTGSEIVVVDPVVPDDPDERARFWRALDRDSERAGSPPVVVLTTARHARSTADVLGRFPGCRVVAPDDDRYETTAPVPVDLRATPGSRLPAGLVAVGTGGPGEIAVWAPAHRTLVTGDVLRGAPDGRLALAPGRSTAATREALRRLLDLPVERVLPTHGGPVTDGALDALRAALG